MIPSLDISALHLLAWATAGYLMGSVPFGLLLTRAMNLGDLRSIGSGNIGATNVLRTGNKAAAAATLLLDGAKAALAVLAARALSGEAAAQIAGLAALIGHCFPVWLGFRGGKGVASFLGLWLALAWPVGLAGCLTWLAAARLTRISSAAALAAVAATPVWCLLLGPPSALALAILAAALIAWRHSENIARLRAGTEPKIGAKSKGETP